MRSKKIVLVFPPLTMPTSPPLGASMLKGYIERELPEWQVKVLDLNLWCFRFLLSGIESGEIGLAPEMYQRLEADKTLLLQAAKTFEGLDNDAFYGRPDLYDRYGSVFIRFTEVFCELLTQECDQWEKTRMLSPLLRGFLMQILSEKPDCVGISMIFSEQLPIGAMLGHFLRKQHGLRIFMGGSCFTEGVEHFMKWYPEAADVIVSGDGEEALRQLLTSGGDPEKIAGTTYWKNGQVKRNSSLYRKDIDHYGTPDFSGLDLNRYYSPEPVVPLLLSRGCYWRKCTFCVHYFSAGDTYRMHSMDNVIDMLRGFTERGITNFSFVDEMIAPGHFVQLAKAIKEADLKISYYALSKPNKTFTPKVLQEMQESGCKYILWGVESGCQRVLDLMGKGTRKEEVAEVLRHAHSAGIANHVYIICGFPTETHEEFDETLQFLDQNKDHIYAIHRSVFSLEAGSPISKDLEKFGIEEVWLRKDTPLGGRLGYRCSSGVSMEEAVQNFQRALPFYRVFNPYARFLANFRDHALLIYKYLDSRLEPNRRKFPSLTAGTPAPHNLRGMQAEVASQTDTPQT